MTDPTPASRPAEPDPVLHLVEIFLGAATTLFLELCLLLVHPVLVIAQVVLFVVGGGLALLDRPRWFGLGVMLGVAVPVLYVLLFIRSR